MTPKNQPAPVLKKWQKKAIENGRRPLPNASGERPWLAIRRIKLIVPDKVLSGLEAGKDGIANHHWSRLEFEQLLEMRKKGHSWHYISTLLPGRSLMAVQQAWYKYNDKPLPRYITRLDKDKKTVARAKALGYFEVRD